MHCAHAFAPSTPDNVSADEEEEPLLRKESSSSSSGACEALIADSSVLQSTILERAGSSPLASYLVSPSTLTHRHPLHSFYERQNSFIESLIETEALHTLPSSGSEHLSLGTQASSDAPQPSSEEEEEEEDTHTRRALNVSFAANIALLVVRVGAALLSGSLALLATSLDAVLDVVSGAIIWATSHTSRHKDKHRFPIGKSRMAPLGVVVFCTVMATAAASLVVEGIGQLVQGVPDSDEGSAAAPIAAVIGSSLFVVGVKGGLWALCRNSRDVSVQALALDHLNDVVVNTVGLAGAVLGRYVVWWCDPATAIAMSVWLIWAWGSTAYEHFLSLVGVAAPPQLLQKLMFVVLHTDTERVRAVDTVRAYSFGGGRWVVEVGVVLHPATALADARDMGRLLQAHLERLPEVARAHVCLECGSARHPGAAAADHKDMSV